MDKHGKIIKRLGITDFANSFTWGLEVERYRIAADGTISNEPYPKAIGDQSQNPYLTNDFFEVQSELVSPVNNSIIGVYHCTAALDHTLRAALAENEYLWPLSMPPVLSETHEELCYPKTESKKLEYLKELGERYGKIDGSTSGLHVNLAPTKEWTSAIAELEEKSEREVRDELLLKMAIGFMRNRWLLTYLFGASPVAEKGYLADLPKTPVRSLRNSTKFGYSHVSRISGGVYSSVAGYVQKIRDLLSDGTLVAESGYHEPVRLRNLNGLDALLEEGVNHIELRMLDLNPLNPQGITKDVLRFIHVMALNFMVQPQLVSTAAALKNATEMNNEVALEQPVSRCAFQEEALKFVQQLEKVVVTFELPREYHRVVQEAKMAVRNSRLTLAGQLIPHIEKMSLRNFGITQAKFFQDRTIYNSSPVFEGFAVEPCPDKAKLQEELFDQFQDLPEVRTPHAISEIVK